MKPIPNFPNYFADELGNIYSMRPRGGRGYGKSPKQPRPVKPSSAGDYLTISLQKNGAAVCKTVHSLILETFIGKRPIGMWACHNDGNNKNNRLDNLRWDTPKNNQADKNIHGTMAHGERIGSCKLNTMQVRVIRRCSELGMEQRHTAKIFNISQSTINNIANRKVWKHL